MAFIDSVTREEALKFIAQHLYRMSASHHATMYVTPRQWYAAPFR